MAKVVEKAKAAVKKVTAKKVAAKEEKVTHVTCDGCNGTGLIDRDNLCVICDGSGQKAA